jgi:hypothetical protein
MPQPNLTLGRSRCITLLRPVILNDCLHNIPQSPDFTSNMPPLFPSEAAFTSHSWLCNMTEVQVAEWQQKNARSPHNCIPANSLAVACSYGCSSLHVIFIKINIQNTTFIRGAEPFLRSRQLRSYPRTSQHFMEPEGSLPCSQDPPTRPYPETDQSNPYHPILLSQLPSISGAGIAQSV